MKKLLLILSLAGGLYSPIVMMDTVLPNVSINLMDGKQVFLDELLDDGPVLIDFWATWCAPCKKEMVYLDQFDRKYKDAGLKIICISTDSPKSMSKVKSYIRAKNFEFLVGLDPNQQLAQRMNALLLPTLMIVNKKRELVWYHQGYLLGDELEIEKQIRLVLNLIEEESAD